MWSYQSASFYWELNVHPCLPDGVGWGKWLGGYVSLENTFLSFRILSRMSTLLEQMNVCTYAAKAYVSYMNLRRRYLLKGAQVTCSLGGEQK